MQHVSTSLYSFWGKPSTPNGGNENIIRMKKPAQVLMGPAGVWGELDMLEPGWPVVGLVIQDDL